MDSNLNLGERVELWQIYHRTQDRLAAMRHVDQASKLIAELDTENRDLANHRIEAEAEAASYRERLVESDRRLTEALIDVEQLRNRLGITEEQEVPDEPVAYVLAWEALNNENMRWALEDDGHGVNDLYEWSGELLRDGYRVRTLTIYFTESVWCSYMGIAAGPGLVMQAMQAWLDRSPVGPSAPMHQFGLALATDVEIGGLS